jgi:glyoxylate/hydroxypyruvate reductase A
MSELVICFNNKDPYPWKKALQDALPKSTIHVWENGQHYEQACMALCWLPNEDILNTMPNLQLLQSVGAGVDFLFKLDLGEHPPRIARVVDNSLSQDMFEFLLGLLLSNMKRLGYYQMQQGKKQWSPQSYRRIEQTKITIVGLGQIGSYIATKLHQLGFQVSGYAQTKKNLVGIHCFDAAEGFDASVHQADYVVNVLPLTDATQGFYNKERFTAFKSSSIFINIGRGGHVVDKDLIEALDIRQVSEAYLDVFHQEPLASTHPFWTHPKVHITPHIAGVTSTEATVKQIVANFLAIQGGKALVNEVSVKKGY